MRPLRDFTREFSGFVFQFLATTQLEKLVMNGYYFRMLQQGREIELESSFHEKDAILAICKSWMLHFNN